jgi:OPT family oligopeptide transporter
MPSEPLATASNPVPEDDFELPVEGFQGTPEEIERQWFEKVYRGRGDSMAQLTWRAILMGSVLGGVLSLTNLYIGLKSGWGFGVAITACILSYSFWGTLHKLGLVSSQMTILENNCMQSTASSAGYSTGGTLISAFAAYMLLNPDNPMSVWLMLTWVFFLAVLGVTMAIPMKRQMINVEQLRFPSGIAAAETLQSLYSHGDKAARAAKSLLIAGVLAGLNQLWTNGLTLIEFWMNKLTHLSVKLAPYSCEEVLNRFNERFLSKAWIGRTVVFGWEPIFIAAGAMTGLRVSTSILLGGTLCWAVFVPIIQSRGITNADDYKALMEWTVWGGAACMVSSGLFSFAMQWRTMIRAVASLRKALGRKEEVAVSEMSSIETPMSWFFIGQAVSLVALSLLAYYSFGMPIWQSAIAVPFAFVLSLVACRVTGETDTTPVGAMGQVTQIAFGGISHGSGASAAASVNVTLMSANITSAAAGSAADLLTDLKSGYLLGAHPRKQFIAQFAGIFAGTLVTVLCFRAMVPDPAMLGTKYPASAALTWKTVAVVMSRGFESLETVKVWGLAVGALVGILLPLLCLLFPKQEKWIPSAAGMGLAWTFPWYYSLMFFLGAIVAYGFEKTTPEKSKEYLFPVASGIIAGDSLMAVAVSLLKAAFGLV